MLRTIAPAAAAAVFVFAGACARQSEGPSTTTLTSGPTSGARVTGARAERYEISLRLADETCAREGACNHIGDGARYRSDEACLVDQAARAPIQISKWTCTPAQTAASFEQCLAAIRSERCETTLARADDLVACRSSAVCGR